MATQVTDQEIKSFVRKVQNQLAGLKSDDLRELTENLEADLLDRREAEGAKFNLGDAKAYANELIESAGLGSESVEVSRLNIEFLKIWKSTLAYFRTLAPAWAIVRGWLMFALIYTPLVYGRVGEVPGNTRDTLILIALIGLNIWLSKKQFGVLRVPLIAINVLLLAGSPIVVADLNGAYSLYAKYVVFENEGTLTYQGHPVRAVCATDKERGEIIYNASELLDEDGYTIFTNDGTSKTRNCYIH